MDFDAVADAVAGIPFMDRHQGKLLYDHVRTSGATNVLELGTAHGVGAAYMAAALGSGGNLVTVDFEGASFVPSPDEVLAQAGLSDRVEIVRRYSSYTWWLKQEIEEHPEPRFDFVFLDGAKNWTIDGLAVYLIERVLRPGGWLLMDDLGWTYDTNLEREVSDGVVIRSLSPEERREPHLKAVFNLIVARHPSFSEMLIQDDWWGWARKMPGEPKRLTIETTKTPSAVVMGVLRRWKNEIRRRRATRA